MSRRFIGAARNMSVGGQTVMPVGEPPTAVPLSQDYTYGPVDAGLVDSTSGLRLFGPNVGSPVPLDATEQSTGSISSIARTRVMMQVPALTDNDGRGVLNHNEGEFLFVRDAHETIRRDNTMGEVYVYNLSDMNCFLEKQCEQSKRFIADMLDGDRRTRDRRRAESSCFIVNPTQFSERISYIGPQFSGTKTKAGENWRTAIRAGVTIFAALPEGRNPVANLWGEVSEGTEVGWLVRAFPDPTLVGTEEALRNPAPLRVVPVVKNTQGGVADYVNFGPKLVQKSGDLKSMRKRSRRTMEEVLQENQELKASAANGGYRAAENMSNRLRYQRVKSNVRVSSTISDADMLERYTSSGTIYGLDRQDMESEIMVNPERIAGTYRDTVVEFVDTEDGPRAFTKSVLQKAKYLRAGVVQCAPHGGCPPLPLIAQAVFNQNSDVFGVIRSKYTITLQNRV